MCRDLKLRLIPVVIIVAAVFAGLIIFTNTPEGLFVFFAAALGIAFSILVVTGILAAICGLQQRKCLKDPGDHDHDRPSPTCFAVRCFGTIILITALIAIIASLLVIEGAFAAFAPIVNAILGIIFAIIFSTMLVYFTGLFTTIIRISD